jgi:ComF family protein
MIAPSLQTWYARLLDLVFPPRCPGCRARGFLLCPTCLQRCQGLRLDREPVTPTSRSRKVLASERGLYQYDEPLRAAIWTFKYRRRPNMAAPLGGLLVEAVPDDVRDCDALVPVPLHHERLAQRGFNQSALLAKHLASALQRPVHDSLRRIRATPHQVGMSRPEREANVRDAFVWYGAAIPPRILLVDDVVTTGATMRECARALRAAGAISVRGIALASG